ncbi:MAG: hypothetical protein LUG18_12960 [Candidatus Azobacteroides sp.]|nr:hypothetical protein [Candidatus Azobacteroides sp.]
MSNSYPAFSMKNVNTRLNLVLFILISIFCYGFTLFYKEQPLTFSPDGYSSFFFNNIHEHYLIFQGLNLLLILLSCLLLLLINQRFSIIRNKTILPFVFYTLFITTDVYAFYSFSGNIVTFLFLLCVFQLCNTYQKQKVVEQTFNIGLFLGIASLFYTPVLFLLPIFWISFGIFKIDSLKAFLASLIGIITPYWFVFFWFLYQENLQGFFQPFLTFFHFDPTVVLSFKIPGWIRVGFTFMITLLGIINFQLNNFKDKIRTRIIFYFTIVSIIGIAILLGLGIISIEYTGPYYLLVSLFAAHFFSTINNRLNTIFFYLVLVTYINLLFF